MSRSIWKGPYIDQTILKTNKNVRNQVERLAYPSLSHLAIDTIRTPQVVSQETWNPIFSPWVVTPRSSETKYFLGSWSTGYSNYLIEKEENLEVVTKEKEYPIVDRRSMIIPSIYGKKYQIKTGNKSISLSIREELVGHFFGEFATTKKIAQYKRKSKIKKKGKSRG